ncbi:MAG: sugar phosphate isomerase/epimerase family protein [Planctomycetota bacterium]
MVIMRENAMQYGVCGGPEMAAAAKEAGYDFFEWSVPGLLKPREDEKAFKSALAEVQACGVPCPALNLFIPSDLKITGPEADAGALEQFVSVTCRRAGQAGVETIVLGSGGARRIPDGFDRDEAHRQIVAFCRMAGPLAAAQGVTIAVEPLNQRACNVLTSVQESADLVREVNHPAIRLLVDAWHWATDDHSIEAIVANGRLLAHVHIATYPTRLPPGAEPFDWAPFFAALREGGYNGRISIEGKIPDPPRDLPRALAVMRSLARDDNLPG